MEWMRLHDEEVGPGNRHEGVDMEWSIQESLGKFDKKNVTG
jgi:hypothetical protein